MLENSWYSVISPENCSTILWRTWDYKEQAAEALKLTAENMYSNGLVDGIIPEPIGGAHSAPQEMAYILKEAIKKSLAELKTMTIDELIDARVEKYSNMGEYEYVDETVKTDEK
jgi:acetyl-CoA carboxylase carboxyl transferase subunit alpha